MPPIPFLLHLELTREEAAQMKKLLNRAVNTMEPKDWPTWLVAYFDALEAFLELPR